MIVVNFVAAMIKREAVSYTVDKNNKGQTEQVLVATRNNNGIIAVIMNVQMAWSHRRLADRGRNQHGVCHLLLFHLSLYAVLIIICVCLSGADAASVNL